MQACPKRDVPSIAIKPIKILHGEPYIKWSEFKVSIMSVIENLHHVIVGNFFYGWSDLKDLCIAIPVQCNIKGGC